MAVTSRASFVQETTTTTGTGTYTLEGATAGSRTFVAGNGDGAVVRYSVQDGTDFEVCEGTITDAASDTLTRDTVLESSNSDLAVNWGAGTKTISQVWTPDEADSASTVADDSVTNAKLANVATSTLKGRATAGTGDPEDLTATQVRTLINVADGANNYTHPNHTGDVTSSGDGATTLTVSAMTSKTALASGLAATDELFINDGGVLKRMDVSVLAELLLRIDNTGNKSVSGNPYIAEQVLSDGATVSWNIANGAEARVTLGGNRTLDATAIPPAGTWCSIRVLQDGTGNRTLSYSADFDFGDAGSPTLSTAANRDDVLAFRSSGGKLQFMGISQGFV